MVANKSGNPANKKASGRTTEKKAAATVTSASEWKKSSTSKGAELTVPSGKVCLVKRPGIEMFTKRGAIPNGLMAQIAPLIEEAQAQGARGDKGESISPEELEKLQMDILTDPQKLEEMVELVDMVALECVLAPELHPVPDDEADRDEDLLYVDEVDFEDKLFIFNYAVGGSDDLERFRQGTTPALAH